MTNSEKRILLFGARLGKIRRGTWNNIYYRYGGAPGGRNCTSSVEKLISEELIAEVDKRFTITDKGIQWIEEHDAKGQ